MATLTKNAIFRSKTELEAIARQFVEASREVICAYFGNIDRNSGYFLLRIFLSSHPSIHPLIGLLVGQHSGHISIENRLNCVNHTLFSLQQHWFTFLLAHECVVPEFPLWLGFSPEHLLATNATANVGHTGASQFGPCRRLGPHWWDTPLLTHLHLLHHFPLFSIELRQRCWGVLDGGSLFFLTPHRC